jgi:hypothetical protein
VAHKAADKVRELKLPVMVSGPTDIGRLFRELELIDQALLQLGLRKGGSEVKMPKTSRLMDQVIETNKLNLLHKLDRTELEHFLNAIKEKSPVLHMSFSADPSPGFIEKLMTWLRKEIHPQLLLTIGLQPTIGAGCIVRTTNKQFDFSLREDFLSKRELLLGQIAAPGVQPAKESISNPEKTAA